LLPYFIIAFTEFLVLSLQLIMSTGKLETFEFYYIVLLWLEQLSLPFYSW